MRWVAPTEKDEANHRLEKRLWGAADQFRANSGFKAGEYSGPVLGLIFLRFGEARFAQRRAQLEKAGTSARRGTSRIDDPHKAVGAFDFALANPPFNVNAVDKDRLKDAVGRDAKGNARRFPFGLPRTENLVDRRMASYSGMIRPICVGEMRIEGVRCLIY